MIILIRIFFTVVFLRTGAYTPENVESSGKVCARPIVMSSIVTPSAGVIVNCAYHRCFLKYRNEEDKTPAAMLSILRARL